MADDGFNGFKDVAMEIAMKGDPDAVRDLLQKDGLRNPTKIEDPEEAQQVFSAQVELMLGFFAGQKEGAAEGKAATEPAPLTLEAMEDPATHQRFASQVDVLMSMVKTN